MPWLHPPARMRRQTLSTMRPEQCSPLEVCQANSSPTLSPALTSSFCPSVCKQVSSAVGSKAVALVLPSNAYSWYGSSALPAAQTAPPPPLSPAAGATAPSAGWAGPAPRRAPLRSPGMSAAPQSPAGRRGRRQQPRRPARPAAPPRWHTGPPGRAGRRGGGGGWGCFACFISGQTNAAGRCINGMQISASSHMPHAGAAAASAAAAASHLPAHPLAHRQQRGSSDQPPPVASPERCQLASPLPPLPPPTPGCCQIGAWPLERCWLRGAPQQSRALACPPVWWQLLLLLLLWAMWGCHLAWRLQSRCGAWHLDQAAAPGLPALLPPQVCLLLPLPAVAPSVQPVSRQTAARGWCTCLHKGTAGRVWQQRQCCQGGSRASR